MSHRMSAQLLLLKTVHKMYSAIDNQAAYGLFNVNNALVQCNAILSHCLTVYILTCKKQITVIVTIHIRCLSLAWHRATLESQLKCTDSTKMWLWVKCGHVEVATGKIWKNWLWVKCGHAEVATGKMWKNFRSLPGHRWQTEETCIYHPYIFEQVFL